MIEIIALHGYEGPNRYGPRAGVALIARATSDLSARLRYALKEAAQQVGVVVGALTAAAAVDGDEHIVSLHFATPTPVIGADLVHYVVAGLNAQLAGDEEWDADGALWDLQRRRRAEALPVAVLQTLAEAASRGIPAFVTPEGRLQIGYGTHGWSAVVAEIRADNETAPFARAPLAVPWEQLGSIPVIALVGGAAADAAARALADALAARGLHVVLALQAGFAAARAALCDPQASYTVLSLAPEDLAARGLPFDRCSATVLLDLPPAEDPIEQARTLGVAVLVTAPSGIVVLNVDHPGVADLARFAPCPVVALHAADGAPLALQAVEAILAVLEAR